MQIPNLYIAHSTHGRGVFTAAFIPTGSVIEVCHVIEISKSELPIIHKTVLHDYYFQWGEKMDSCVIALGYGSLYNHAIFSNANFVLDIFNKTIDIEATRDIEAGEEIFLNYHGEYGNEEKLWF